LHQKFGEVREAQKRIDERLTAFEVLLAHSMGDFRVLAASMESRLVDRINEAVKSAYRQGDRSS